MTTRKIHYLSGITLTVFIGLHLLNHFCSIFGAGIHMEIMDTMRPFYRNIFLESVLLLAVFMQIVSGIKLFKTSRKNATSFFGRLQIRTGLYLALFLIIHLSAVFAGRFVLQLDTNFYFGVAGLNSFPANLFFIPYYALAILSFFGHVVSIHSKKMNRHILGLSPISQSVTILVFAVLFTIATFYGLTNHFKGVEIPAEYKVLTGK
jgi:hypothetical protein